MTFGKSAALMVLLAVLLVGGILMVQKVNSDQARDDRCSTVTGKFARAAAGCS